MSVDATTTLSASSTPRDIYAVCTTYDQLCSHKALKPVANLIQCVTSYSNRHHIYNTPLAFDEHRELTLSGRLHKRAHLYVKHAQPSSAVLSSETPATAVPAVLLSESTAPVAVSAESPAAVVLRSDSPAAAVVSSDYRRLQLVLLDTQNVHNLLLARSFARALKPEKQLTTSLGEQYLELAATVLNNRQHTVRFIGPTGAGEYYDGPPTTDVVVRLIHVCDSAGGSWHWVCAVWRSHTSVINILDSGVTTTEMVRQYESVGKFVQYCNRYKVGDDSMQINFVAVDKQSDEVSCGLYCVAFCRVLTANGGLIRDERLLAVDLEDVRAWLIDLVRWLKTPKYADFGYPSDEVLITTRPQKRQSTRAAGKRRSREQHTMTT